MSVPYIYRTNCFVLNPFLGLITIAPVYEPMIKKQVFGGIGLLTVYLFFFIQLQFYLLKLC